MCSPLNCVTDASRKVPRSHFDTFLWSFITIFQILTGENWNTVMYGMRATGWCQAQRRRLGCSGWPAGSFFSPLGVNKLKDIL